MRGMAGDATPGFFSDRGVMSGIAGDGIAGVGPYMRKKKHATLLSCLEPRSWNGYVIGRLTLSQP